MGIKLNAPPDSRTAFDQPAWQGWFAIVFRLFGNGDLGNFTVANLPKSPNNGQHAYATDGRKVGEAAGAGTGVPVYYSNGAWRVFSTDAVVAA